MNKTKRKGVLRKRLHGFKTLTRTLNPKAKLFALKKSKKKLPVFKLLTSGLGPASRILLRKPKSRKRPLNLLEIVKRLNSNAYAKSLNLKKRKGTRKKRKRKKH